MNRLRIFSLIVLIITLFIVFVSILADIKPSIAIDWEFTIPYFIILICLSLILLVRYNETKNWITYLIKGSVIGGGISAALVCISILLGFKSIISDGVAFWAAVEIPIVFIGYASIILGGIAGVITWSIIKKLKSKKKK